MLERLLGWSVFKLLQSVSTTSLLNTCLMIVLTNVLCQILQESRKDTVKEDGDLHYSVMVVTFIWH